MRRLICLLILACSAQAATRYVAKTGANSGACTSAGSPCLTIAYAYGQANAGDTIVVSAGTYSESITMNRAGTSGNPITLQGYPIGSSCPTTPQTDVESPVKTRTAPVVYVNGAAINSSYNKLDCFRMTGGMSVGGTNVAYAEFFNNYVDATPNTLVTGINTQGPGFSGRPNHLHAYHNYITGAQYGTLLAADNSLLDYNEVNALTLPSTSTDDCDFNRLWGDSNTFAYNYFHGTTKGSSGTCRSSQAHNDGWQTFSDDANNLFSRNMTMIGNTVDNFDEGFMLSNDHATANYYGTWTITNNLLVNAGSWCGVFDSVGFIVNFYNNVCHGGNAQLVSRDSWGSGGAHVTAINNIFTGMSSYLPGSYYYAQTGGSVAGSTRNIQYDIGYTLANPAGGSDINGNPQLVSPSSTSGAGDYRLQATSPAINSGNTLASVPLDHEGLSRPYGAGYDMGAYEYGAGSGTAPTITTASLPSGTVGVAYSQTLTATGDTPITWSVVVGSLPAWATLNTSTGAITGTPNAAATTNFTVRATNAAGQNDKALSITIAAAPVAPTITNLSPINTGTVGSAYGYQFNASGTTPITFTATNVPGGLALLNGGWLSGTPTTAGTTTISVTATNSVGSNNKNFQITINPSAVPPTITTTSPLPGGTVGIAYSATVAATGDAPITWSVLSGSLPAWASLNAASGAITGTPNTIATSNFTLQASNAAGTSNRAFALTIAAAIIPPAFITTSPLTGGMVGAGYSVQFTATGSTPITWSASGVPAGLALSASGLLSGSPTTPGTSIIAVTATNAAGSAGPTGFSITISPAPTGAVLRGTFTGSWNIASVIPSAQTYTSPRCDPNVTYAAGTASNGWNGSGAAWACGPYPTTVLPTPPGAACPVSVTSTNACTPGSTPTYADPDTGNRILRITTTGSLNSTANGTQFYTPASGWNKNWAPDSSGVIFAADANREYYVGFNPSNMSTTGSSLLLPSGYQNWQFSGTSSNILYALANPNLVQYNLNTPGTAPTVLKNLNTIPGYISGQVWLAIYRGGDEICAYSGTSSGQGTGRLIACYNLTSGASHLVDVGQTAATFDGAVMSGINVGSLNTLHSIVVGQDGRYVFVDTGQAFGSYSSTPPKNAQFMFDLATGTGSQWSWYSDQTHIAMGYGGIAYQSAGNMLAVTGQLCPYSQSGMDYRTFTTPNPPVLTSGCFQASTTNSTHLSWANNANDANANQYPVIQDTLNNVSGGNKQCLGCGEILALSATTTQNSASVYRFFQKWQTPAQGDYVYSSAQVSNDGRWVLFKSDWLNTAGAAGHRDIFIGELK